MSILMYEVMDKKLDLVVQKAEALRQEQRSAHRALLLVPLFVFGALVVASIATVVIWANVF